MKNMKKDGEHPVFTRSEWREEVNAENTQRGYWDWVRAQQEEADEEKVQAGTQVYRLNTQQVAAIRAGLVALQMVDRVTMGHLMSERNINGSIDPLSMGGIKQLYADLKDPEVLPTRAWLFLHDDGTVATVSVQEPTKRTRLRYIELVGRIE